MLPLLGVTWNLPVCSVFFPPVKYTVSRKTILVSSDYVDGVNWSCSWSGSDWSTFYCVDIRTFLGCWRCPSMVDCFLDQYFCARSDDRPVQEVKIFLCLLSPIHIEWGYSMMCGDNPPGCPLTCTCTHFPQNIRQDLWTPSLVYFAGSNWACTALSVDLLNLSLSHFHPDAE